MNRLSADSGTVKELDRYSRTFEIIMKKKAHTLSAGMEELLAKSMEATQSSSDIFNMFNNADAKFPSITDSEGKEIPVTHGTYIPLMENRDRRVRKSCFSVDVQRLRPVCQYTGGHVRGKRKAGFFFAKARNYGSSRAYLSENEIPKASMTIGRKRFRRLPLFHEYVSVRKKVLGLDEIHMYDLYTPMVEHDDRKIPYEEAKETVKKGLAR